MVRAAASITLGPYQFHERLGEGGSGQVYRATGPQGAVAVKILGPSGELDDAARARFGREIAALQQLAHEHLVTLLDHGVDAELGPYLVLPLLPGASLRVAVAGSICPEAAVLLARPIVGAVAALHAAGYVHRDLKPENVVGSPDGAVTVIDLGLAWRDGMTRHTESGAAVGSVGYMAPEQIDGRAVGPSADVWALGVMLYEWIAGRRPFARARPAEEAAAALIGTFPPLGAADRRCDDELAQLVARCLAMDPERRPRADELARALDELVDWTDPRDPAALRAERAQILVDPAAYQARVAPLRVRRAERRAREALDAGQPFVALALCDRGLAYAPDHPALLAIIAEAERASAKPSEVPAVAAATTAESPTPVARRRRTPWLVGAAVVAVAAIVVAIVATRGPAREPAGASGADPWAASAPTAPAAPPRADDDFASKAKTFTTMASLLGRALDKVDEAEAGKAHDKCLALAEHGDPDAASACDLALRARGDDTTALAARAIAHLRAGRVPAARADIDRAIAVRDDARWHRIRAAILGRAGDAAGARADLARACELGDAVACREAAEP